MLAFGQYGEMRIAHVPQGGGTNVFPLRKSNTLHTATGATLKKTGGKADLVTTQEHGVIPEGRDIIRESVPGDPFKHVVDAHLEIEGNTSKHPSPKIGIPPDGHITEDKLKKEFQGGYGNPQQFPAPAKQKQERFPLDLARPELLDSQAFQWGHGN